MVAVTAFAMREDRERAVRAGFDGYIEKPISVRELPGQVQRFLLDGGRHDDEPTILVVDDQPPNIRLLDAVLSPRGYRVLRPPRARRRWSCCARSSPTSSCWTS